EMVIPNKEGKILLPLAFYEVRNFVRCAIRKLLTSQQAVGQSTPFCTSRAENYGADQSTAKNELGTIGFREIESFTTQRKWGSGKHGETRSKLGKIMRVEGPCHYDREKTSNNENTTKRPI